MSDSKSVSTEAKSHESRSGWKFIWGSSEKSSKRTRIIARIFKENDPKISVNDEDVIDTVTRS